MIAPELLESLNAAMRELLDNPGRDSAWLMLELARLLPGNGPIVTRYGGGSWAASRRWIGRPRDVGVSGQRGRVDVAHPRRCLRVRPAGNGFCECTPRHDHQRITVNARATP